MTDIVYVSFSVMSRSFPQVRHAIHAWGDEERDEPFEYPDADIIIVQKDFDLYAITKEEVRATKIAFRPFNLRDPADFVALFLSSE